MKQQMAAAIVAGLVIVGCGSSDSDSGGDSPQDEVAEIIIGAAADAGAEPDADCIREKAQNISDEDAQAMVDAGLDGQPDISAEAGEVLAHILTC